MDVQSIKRQALDLAGRLKEWERQLDDSSLKLADVREDFEKRYQPEILKLVEAMVARAPYGTPGAAPVNTNIVAFPDMKYLELSLPHEDADNATIDASVQFGTTAQILKQLAAATPEPETA